tara:strand:+ start:2180 stop:4207 length:2028 start_codon:yes stop_codon:yes gene_type:complete
MALGTTALVSEFKSDYGYQYRIKIFDEDGTFSSSTPFTVDSNGFILNYKGKGKERYDTIKESTLEVGMYYGSTGTAKSFIDSLQTSNQGRFKISVERSVNSGLSYSDFWYGVLLADIMTLPDESAPSRATIKASCGLALMKDIDFDRDVYNGSNGAINGLFSTRNFVGNMLEYYIGGVQDFYSGTDVMWYDMVHWYEDTMPTPASSNSPWEYSALYPNAFRDIEYEDGSPVKTESISAYDCLKSILEAFGCRIFQANGYFYVVHHDMWRNDLSKWYYRSMSKTGTELGAGVYDYQNLLFDLGNSGSGESLIKLAGGSQTYYPPLKKTRASYSNWADDGLYSASQDLSDYTTNADMEANLIDIGYCEASGGAYLDLSHYARVKRVSGIASSSTAFYDYVHIIYMIKVGSYYWNDNDQEWTTTQSISTKVLISSIYQYEYIDGNSILNWSYSNIYMQTADLPVSGEVKYFARFVQGNPYTTDGEPQGTAVYDVNILAHTSTNPSMIQYTIDGETPFERIFVTTDENSSANEVMELGKMRIGDGPTTAAPSWGRFRINNGSSWLNTIEENWQAWQTGNEDRITQILTEQNYVGQRDFTNLMEYKFVLRTGLTYVFTPLAAIIDKTINGDPTMVMNGYKFIANTDEVSGEFYQTKINALAITNALEQIDTTVYFDLDYF